MSVILEHWFAILVSHQKYLGSCEVPQSPGYIPTSETRSSRDGAHCWVPSSLYSSRSEALCLSIKFY